MNIIVYSELRLMVALLVQIQLSRITLEMSCLRTLTPHTKVGVPSSTNTRQMLCLLKYLAGEVPLK